MNPFPWTIQSGWKQKEEDSILKAAPQRTLTSSFFCGYGFPELNADFLIPSYVSDPIHQKDHFPSLLRETKTEKNKLLGKTGKDEEKVGSLSALSYPQQWTKEGMT